MQDTSHTLIKHMKEQKLYIPRPLPMKQANTSENAHTHVQNNHTDNDLDYEDIDYDDIGYDDNIDDDDMDDDVPSDDDIYTSAEYDNL